MSESSSIYAKQLQTEPAPSLHSLLSEVWNIKYSSYLLVIRKQQLGATEVDNAFTFHNGVKSKYSTRSFYLCRRNCVQGKGCVNLHGGLDWN